LFKRYFTHSSVIVIFSIVATLLGCEKIEAIKNKFIQKQAQAPAPAPSVSQPAPAQNQPPKPLSANVLARVGSWTITIEEFNERLAALKEVVPEYDINDPQAKRLVLDELVRQQLLVIDAEKRGVANNKDIMAAVDEFRRTLIVREVATKLTKDISVSEEEAKQFYEEQKDILKEPEQWHVREIVVDSQLKANEALLEVLKGADFAQVAQQQSISESAANGGDLGFLQEEPFPEMVDALINLKAGEVSSVFKGPKGFYIVKLDEVRGGEQIPYEEIKQDIIQNRTLVKQQQAILDYLSTLEKEIKVEINEGLLK